MSPASYCLPESPRGVASFDDETFTGEKSQTCSTCRRKSVSFQLEDACTFGEEHEHGDGLPFARVKCYYAPLRTTLSKEEKQSLYWRKKDFSGFKKQSKKLAHTTNEEQHKVYLDLFMNVYSSPPAVGATKVGDNSRDLSCLPLATASVRGLERYIFPDLVNDQRLAKQTLFKAQSKLPDEMDQEQKAFLLASTSTILSRQTRHLARVIGHADSIVALSIYKNTFLPKKSTKDEK